MKSTVPGLRRLHLASMMHLAVHPHTWLISFYTYTCATGLPIANKVDGVVVIFKWGTLYNNWNAKMNILAFKHIRVEDWAILRDTLCSTNCPKKAFSHCRRAKPCLSLIHTKTISLGPTNQVELQSHQIFTHEETTTYLPMYIFQSRWYIR